MEGKVLSVCLSDNKSDPKHPVEQIRLQKGHGVWGDAHAGTTREVSLLAQESVDRLAEEAGKTFPPGVFAENIRVEGIDQRTLKRGDRIQVGKALLEVLEIGKTPDEPHTYSFEGYSLLPTDGIFARVLESGRVRGNDPVRLVET